MSANTVTSARTRGAADTHSTMILGEVSSPLGPFGAVFTTDGLARLTFPSEGFAVCETWAARRMPGARIATERRPLAMLADQLTAYLEGDLRKFSVPLDLRGTPFQVDVWRALLKLDYGEVCSYAALAARIGRPGAVRAVGLANGSNPIPVIVPCHRIIGSDGTLTGYGGGLAVKEQLLRLEGVALSGIQAGRQAKLL